MKSDEMLATVAALLIHSLSSSCPAEGVGPVPPAIDLSVGSKSDGGTFSVLIYNVAGLPQGISRSQPLLNMPRISARLNDYDLVLTQEDFYYVKALRSQTTHAYYAPRSYVGLLGDGLSRFSRFPMSEVDHQAWQACHGYFGSANDCLTPKGFSFARHSIASGVTIDVYDLHADAGNAEGDQEARSNEMDQLIEYIKERSAGRAVIIGGDTNLSNRRLRDMVTLDRLLHLGFTDACRSLSCPKERIDRVIFRGSDRISLRANHYQVEDERFSVDGVPLSDHQAISVTFGWKKR